MSSSIKTLAAVIALALSAGPVFAQAPAPAPFKPQTREGDVVLKEVRFHSGETLPQARMHYTTLGTPRRDASGRVTNAVMVLHGTGGSGAQFLRPQFADVLFKPGGELDPAKWYVILPDDIGHGRSSKPSDGLHAKFPHYDYDDMVELERRLLVEGLHVDHLRLIMGTSMGCMHAFVWGEAHPDFMSALMPLACAPTRIVGRNRIWRYMVADAIRQDPAWDGGEYKTEPLGALRVASDLLLIAGSAPILWQHDDSTPELAEAAADTYTRNSLKTLDANDLLYQIEASRDYDPSADLEKIKAPVMWINSADDFINPPGLGIAEEMVKRISRGRFILIPESVSTHGHGTHTWAAIWKQHLVELLAESERN